VRRAIRATDTTSVAGVRSLQSVLDQFRSARLEYTKQIFVHFLSRSQRHRARCSLGAIDTASCAGVCSFQSVLDQFRSARHEYTKLIVAHFPIRSRRHRVRRWTDPDTASVAGIRSFQSVLDQFRSARHKYTKLIVAHFPIRSRRHRVRRWTDARHCECRRRTQPPSSARLMPLRSTRIRKANVCTLSESLTTSLGEALD
jgi:hypothetical protein